MAKKRLGAGLAMGGLGIQPIEVHRPSLEDHVERLGPQQWELTAVRLEQKNKKFAQAFRAISTLPAVI